MKLFKKLGFNPYRTIKQNLAYKFYLKTHKGQGCNFCTLKDNTLIKKYKYWNIIECRWPYRGTKIHWLLISRVHIPNDYISEFPERTEQEYQQIRQRMLNNGFTLQHNGKRNYSVSHFHVHLMK